jgi:hypothetical protein
MKMLQQSYELTDKIKIAIGENNHSQKYLGFYTNYSSFILQELNKPWFQEFVYCMLSAEKIEIENIHAVDIEVFPTETHNKGFNIIGKCNVFRGKIRIYPKHVGFCVAFGKKFGTDILNDFISERARAALIHELLHLKYGEDEKRVRELTESYFGEYIRKRLGRNSIAIFRLIFGPKEWSKV